MTRTMIDYGMTLMFWKKNIAIYSNNTRRVHKWWAIERYNVYLQHHQPVSTSIYRNMTSIKLWKITSTISTIVLPWLQVEHTDSSTRPAGLAAVSATTLLDRPRAAQLFLAVCKKTDFRVLRPKIWINLASGTELAGKFCPNLQWWINQQKLKCQFTN